MRVCPSIFSVPLKVEKDAVFVPHIQGWVHLPAVNRPVIFHEGKAYRRCRFCKKFVDDAWQATGMTMANGAKQAITIPHSKDVASWGMGRIGVLSVAMWAIADTHRECEALPVLANPLKCPEVLVEMAKRVLSVKMDYRNRVHRAREFFCRANHSTAFLSSRGMFRDFEPRASPPDSQRGYPRYLGSGEFWKHGRAPKSYQPAFGRRMMLSAVRPRRDLTMPALRPRERVARASRSIVDQRAARHAPLLHSVSVAP